MKKIYLSLLSIFGVATLASAQGTPTPFTNCQTTYLITYKNGVECSNGNGNETYKVAPFSLDGTIGAPMYTLGNPNQHFNGTGINKVDSKLYGMFYQTTGNCSINNLGIRLVRFGANSAFDFLGTIPPPAGGTILLEAGAFDGYGNYTYLADVNGQLYLGRVSVVQNLPGVPGNGTQVTLAADYYPITAGSCGQVQNLSDWANGLDGRFYSYGTFAYVENNVVKYAGQVVAINPNTYQLECAGNPATGVFTSTDNDFVGAFFDANFNMYILNGTNRRFYKVDVLSGNTTFVTTVAGSGPISGDFASCVASPFILPIGYTNVSVTSGGECKAVVNWDASGVEAGDIFTLEKSYDGRSFSTVASVRGVAAQTKYSVTDSKTGITNYYRIKGVSKDGTEKYSSVVRFLSSCGGKNNATLFNNLITSGSLNGEVSLYKTQSVSYNIINGAGAKVFSKTAVTSAGVSRFNFNVPALSKGVYLLQIVMGEETKTQKFVVQ